MNELGNTLRLTSFLVCKGDDVADKTQQDFMVVLQRVHRSGELPPRDVSNTKISKDRWKPIQKRGGKLFLKWFPLLETLEEVPEGFFEEAKFIRTDDQYVPYEGEKQARTFLKGYLDEEWKRRDPSGVKKLRKPLIINLCHAVVIQVENFNKNGNLMNKGTDLVLFKLPVKKPQNYAEMTEATLEHLPEGILPEKRRTAVKQVLTVLPELAPDSRDKWNDARKHSIEIWY